MALRSLQYTWAACNNQAIFQTKLVNQAGQLQLDGSLVNPYTGKVEFLANHGTPRSISINADEDLSDYNFTVNGYQNGVFLSIQYTGPDTTTAYFPDAFDIITSISIDNAPNAHISIGTGYSGYFPLLNIKLQRDYLNYTLAFAHTSGGTVIPTTVYYSLKNMANCGETYDYLATVNGDPNVFTLKVLGSSNNYVYSAQNAISGLLVKLTGSTATLAETMQLNFLQT